jgi:hypothetical protein
MQFRAPIGFYVIGAREGSDDDSWQFCYRDQARYERARDADPISNVLM